MLTWTSRVVVALRTFGVFILQRSSARERHTYTYIVHATTYIYMCVCVCVCDTGYLSARYFRALMRLFPRKSVDAALFFSCVFVRFDGAFHDDDDDDACSVARRSR